MDVAIRPGERVLLLGASGSGKSTLLLTLTGLIPQAIPASLAGAVRVFGTSAGSRPPWGWAADVAHYFQDADQTLCGMRVEDEIAFPLENRALPEASIDERVSAAMRAIGLPDAWRDRRSSALSGGERQLVALAATWAQDARLLAVDEPTAHLAPAAAGRLHALLAGADSGRAALIVDHRLDGLVEAIDRVAVLGREGRIAAMGEPRGLFRAQRALLASLGIWRPAASELDAALGDAGAAGAAPPLNMGEVLAPFAPGVASADLIGRARPVVEAFVRGREAAGALAGAGRPIARLANADCAAFLGPTVLRGINLEIRGGEILGILGANGAGKSTLGACLAGQLPLKAGTRHGAPGGIAFQRPQAQFTAVDVRQEIATTLPRAMARKERERRVEAAIAAWGLSGFETRHPLALSQGEQRRLALASLAASDRWPLLVLDEPIAGLDARGAEELTERIAGLAARGRGIALITHDMDLALRLCPGSIVLGEGRILAAGPTAQLLSDPSLLSRAGLTEPSCAPARRWLERTARC